VPRTRSRPRLYYERHGEGEPLLLVTGFTISGAVFEPIIPAYSEHFECILYDNRASGRSQTPPRLTSIPELAADAVRLMDELGIESAHVLGLSMGGMIAQELALRFPERVRGLVLGCTTPGGPRAARPNLLQLAGLGVGIAGAVRLPGRPWLAAALFSPEFRREQPDRVLWLLEHFERHLPSPIGANAHWWSSVFHDTVSRLDQIQAPTLVMHGGRDRMNPFPNSRMLAERIPDAELVVVPGVGHAYLLEAPELSLELMLDWFRAREQPIPAGRPRTDWTAPIEPLTRALSLHTSTLRTGLSLVGLVGDILSGERRRTLSRTTTGTEEGDDVAIDGRAASAA
jgi:pimeloyl-ACP methyl ester carboxylesterase